MARKKFMKFDFFKINYMHNLSDYSANGKSERDIFHEKIHNFFEKNFKGRLTFKLVGIEYQFAAIEIDDNYIFGKIWKLKEKSERDFEWNGNDYVTSPELVKNYRFIFFLLSLKSHHLVLQDEIEISSNLAKNLLESWFDEFNKTKNGIVIQHIKNKKEFLTQLKEAKRIVSAKFVSYPSNYDTEEITRPLDEELKKLKIEKYKQEMESKRGISLDLEKANIFSSPLFQSIRGNGQDPKIVIEEDGARVPISTKKEYVKREMDEDRNPESVKKKLIDFLNKIIKELNENA